MLSRCSFLSLLTSSSSPLASYFDSTIFWYLDSKAPPIVVLGASFSSFYRPGVSNSLSLATLLLDKFCQLIFLFFSRLRALRLTIWVVFFFLVCWVSPDNSQLLCGVWRNRAPIPDAPLIWIWVDLVWTSGISARDWALASQTSSLMKLPHCHSPSGSSPANFPHHTQSTSKYPW